MPSRSYINRDPRRFLKPPTPRQLFHVQKGGAKRRGIEWKLTFDEWWKIWQDSGRWKWRGSRAGQFVMSRYRDQGAYEVGNVFIQTCGENISSGFRFRRAP